MGYNDKMAETDEDKIEKLVDENTRKELNEMAREEGIKSPKRLPRKRAVAKEIVKAKKAKEYAKEPTGLYFSD